MSARIDVSFYAIIDEASASGRDADGLASRLVEAGVTVLQYRAKNLSSRDFLSRATAIRQAIQGSRVPLIVNDRPDIAALSGAQGVHLGSEDVPVSEARRFLGSGLIIGRTVRNPADAISAERDGADYVGAGSVFSSPTKQGIPVIGLEGLRQIRSCTRIPLVAIGGLTLENAAEVLSTGVDGLAFASELLRGEDVGSTARELRRAVTAYLRARANR